MSQQHIRVRFAPSPTGPLHLGGVRTALYNYLFAKKHGGTFILRIEDTDKKRFVPNSESYILKTLKWCHIEPDEGVGYGGPYSPYHQSKRINIYRYYINQLLNNGYAYYAFETDDDLGIKRKEYKNMGLTFSYNYENRNKLDNSLNMTKEQLKKKLDICSSYVIRFKINPGEKLKMHDIIRGWITIHTDQLDDKILLKSDGVATYHLASTIDDHLMKITHVIRGEEWLSSLALHFLLYRSFGWDPPNFAHLPLILKKDGKGKISKRNPENFPIYPMQWINGDTIIPGYKELGYFPDAFVNMLALLGWNPGGKREIFSLQELVKTFSLSRIKKSGVFFDIKKVYWFNKKYLISKKEEVFSFMCKKMQKNFILYEKDYLWKVIHLTINRIHFIHEIWEHSFYFFTPPSYYDTYFLRKIKNNHEQIIFKLKNAKLSLYKINPFTYVNVKLFFQKYENKCRIKMMQLFRFALVGNLKGVDLFTILEMIGKKESIQRLDNLINKIK
ncbi:glutamate--tRNA ligase [Blattabacterium cuenoti]|uniref:glutamate--tRNA ligase n=1 Tax=Blattabacterium cuenoti TaxID=1653831 RepID=UPI00163D300D|nr:glutamate--tRNA ligase [Blattabacterium cuenoti]